MRLQKPILHGRDHAPGGADPIPNWPTSTGGGGNQFFFARYNATFDHIVPETDIPMTEFSGLEPFTYDSVGQRVQIQTAGVYEIWGRVTQPTVNSWFGIYLHDVTTSAEIAGAGFNTPYATVVNHSGDTFNLATLSPPHGGAALAMSFRVPQLWLPSVWNIQPTGGTGFPGYPLTVHPIYACDEAATGVGPCFLYGKKIGDYIGLGEA